MTKPKQSKSPKSTEVGPTCVVTYADGETVRMSTYNPGKALDFARGLRLAEAAWRTRKGCYRQYNPNQAPTPAVLACHFERHGEVIGVM